MHAEAPVLFGLDYFGYVFLLQRRRLKGAPLVANGDDEFVKFDRQFQIDVAVRVVSVGVFDDVGASLV